MNQSNLIAPCGVFCEVCPQRIAYTSDNARLKEKLAANYGVKPEEIVCEGCTSEQPFVLCRFCDIKSCVNDKHIESCAECDKFPCEIVENFPVKPFIKKVKWDVDYRQKHGKDEWISKSIELNTCPTCQSLNHWVARRCISCKDELPERY